MVPWLDYAPGRTHIGAMQFSAQTDIVFYLQGDKGEQWSRAYIERIETSDNGFSDIYTALWTYQHSVLER